MHRGCLLNDTNRAVRIALVHLLFRRHWTVWQSQLSIQFIAHGNSSSKRGPWRSPSIIIRTMRPEGASLRGPWNTVVIVSIDIKAMEKKLNGVETISGSPAASQGQMRFLAFVSGRLDPHGERGAATGGIGWTKGGCARLTVQRALRTDLATMWLSRRRCRHPHRRH